MNKLSTKGKPPAYMPSSEGPFRCDHCEYYPSSSNCNNKTVIGWARDGLYGLSLNAAGMANVDPGGCSNEFRRKK